MLHLGTRRPFLMSVIALLVLGVASARGQSTLATLTGTVVDGSAAVVPGASVVATNLATGVAAPGRHAIPRAAFWSRTSMPGRYVVTVSIQGFQDNVLRGRAAGAAGRARRRPAADRRHGRACGSTRDAACDRDRQIDHRPFAVRRRHRQARPEFSRHGQHEPDRRGDAGARRSTGSHRRDLDGRRAAVHDVVLGRRHLITAYPLRRPVARAVSVGRIHRGIQGHDRRQQRRVHAGNRPDDDHEERIESAPRHRVLVLPGQRDDRRARDSPRRMPRADRSSRRCAPTASADRPAALCYETARFSSRPTKACASRTKPR